MSRLRKVAHSGDELGLARTVVAVRAAVVVSIGVLLLVGPDWVRQYVGVTLAVLAAAMTYSVALLFNPRPRPENCRRGCRPVGWRCTSFSWRS